MSASAGHHPVGQIALVVNNSGSSSSTASGSSSGQSSSNNNNNGGEGGAVGRGLLSANSQSYSEIPMQKFSHLWTIKQFNLIPVELERLCSPWFSPPNSKDLWFLKLRLKAFDENNGNQEFIGVHLFLKESGDKKKEVRAHYTISVLDSAGNKRFTGECSKPEGRIFKAGTEGHGYKLLCPRDGIFRPENKLLGEDSSLNIRCEVTVFGEIKHTAPKSEFASPFTEDQKNSHSLSADLGRFLPLNKGTDSFLISRDGKRIGVHRSILMARSDYFMSAFELDMKEKKSNEIKLDDIESDVLTEMVRYMYSDEIPTLSQMPDSLLLVADRYVSD
jgi:hypothetical protein